MELSQLRYFKALAESNNLTKTAAMLYISAPTLSLSISRLERELGTQLFDRVKGRLSLNDRGQVLLDAISSGLDVIDSAVDTVKILGTSYENRVKIATTNQILFNGMIASFLHAFPNVYFSHSNHPVSYFEHDSLLIQFDFILARSGTIRSESLLRVPLFSCNELMVSVPLNHHLSSRKSVRLEELAGERLIFPTKTSNSEGLYDFYYRICCDAGFVPNVVADCNYLTMSYLFSMGLGICFTSSRGCDLDAFSSGICLHVEGCNLPEDYWPHDLYYDRRRKLSSAAISFRDYALHYFDE